MEAALFVQNAQGQFVPVGPNASVPARTNAARATPIVHRSGITTIDKISVPTAPTGGVDVTSGGALAQATSYYMALAFGNKYGSTGAGAISTAIATAASGGSVHCVKATGATATVGTPEYVDIFMWSSSTAPLGVGRCTYAQFTNANGVIVTAVGTVTAGSGLGAQVVQVNVVGTGLATNVAPFLSNNAYTPDVADLGGYVNCTGYSIAHIKLLVSVTDLRSLPTLIVLPFLLNIYDQYWDATQLLTVPLLTSTGQLLRSDYTLNVDGSTGLLVAVDSLTGQGTSVTILVELC